MKKSYKNNKFKISAPTWNEEFEWPYSEYTFKKHWEKTVNPSITTYISKIGNRITFEINTGYYIQILIPETMKLLGSTKNNITEYENEYCK